ncbi:hypothetical protein EDD15DRAFT_2534389 [Pisolithus albus]|nr:hypothetical protein EDD15DRAFT_2534389 [Pisolithus albus]
MARSSFTPHSRLPSALCTACTQLPSSFPSEGNHFTTPGLSGIARNLDAMEYSYNRESNGDEGSMNMDDTGYFSVQLLESALNVFGLSLLRWRSEAARPYRDKPQYSANGVFNFWALVGYGYLNPDGSVASGMLSIFDNCSQMPFLYDSNSQILFSYGNPQSFTAKGQYISQAGLCGFAMYKVGGDYNNMLISTINMATSL